MTDPIKKKFLRSSIQGPYLVEWAGRRNRLVGLEKLRITLKIQKTQFSIVLVVSHESKTGCVHPLARQSVLNAFVSAGRDKPANFLFHVNKLVFFLSKQNSDFFPVVMKI